MNEREELIQKIKEVYLDTKVYSFSINEVDSFLKTAAHYVERSYLEKGQYRYDSAMLYLYDSKADSIIDAVAEKDYNWL